MKRLIFITITLFCLSQVFAAATDDSDDNASGVDRYAIYIGSNKGGKGREQLLYAGSDAQNFQKAMSEIGGVNDANSYVLIDPTKEKIDDTLNKISRQISTSHTNAKRSEFIFYYSGHSDENSLLLGDVPYDYSSLKAAITDVPSDIHVVILDSCYSGNFIRTKGGQKRKPFLIDDSSVVTGHAYLSSSSTNEYSQESDEIESSYFTNAMITGLRGAADTSGDNKVTLNELYSYAFNETLSKTESSKAGPQHPNYNITLVGSGDLVLSDISSGESMLSLSKEAKGKFIIRNAEGKLISEINKVTGQPIFMALPSGQYSAVIIDEYSTKQGTFILKKDQIYVLDQNALSTIQRKTNRVRGSEESETDADAGEIETEIVNEKLEAIDYEDEDILTVDDLENYEKPVNTTTTGSRRRFITSEVSDSDEDTSLPDLDLSEIEADDEDASPSELFDSYNPADTSYFHLSVFPGVSITGGERDHTMFSVGIFGAYDRNVYAMQYSSIGNIISGNLFGVQTSGLFNIAGDTSGAQVTGLFNIANNLNGGQVSGLFNIARNVNGIQITGLFNSAKSVNGAQVSGLLNVASEVHGAQVGVINIADTNDGVALGVINIIKDGMHHIGFAWDTNDMFDWYFQSGTKNLFFTIGEAMKRKEVFSDNDDVAKTFIYYAGLGTEFRFGISSLDLEYLAKFVYNNDYIPQTSEDLSDFKFEEYFIPSFRITFNPVCLGHFDFSLGASFDFRDHGTNDRAFEIAHHKWAIGGDDASVYPALFIGFKFK